MILAIMNLASLGPLTRLESTNAGPAGTMAVTKPADQPRTEPAMTSSHQDAALGTVPGPRVPGGAGSPRVCAEGRIERAKRRRRWTTGIFDLYGKRAKKLHGGAIRPTTWR
jgi:hypothetical protein